MEELKEYHKQYKKCAIVFLRNYPRFIVQEHEVECTSDLGNKIDHAYNRYKKKTTEGKREILIEFVSDLIIPISTVIAGGVAMVFHLPAIFFTSTLCVCAWGFKKKYFNKKEKEKYD